MLIIGLILIPGSKTSSINTCTFGRGRYITTNYKVQAFNSVDEKIILKLRKYVYFDFFFPIIKCV